MPSFRVPLVNSQFIINVSVRDTKDLERIQQGNGRYKSSPTYKMLIDTGATGTCIKEDILQDMQISPIGQTNMLTAGKTIVANLYDVIIEVPIDTLLKAQGKRVRQRESLLRPVKALGLTEENEKMQVDGLLGIDVLRYLVWHYNGFDELSISFREESPIGSNISRNAICPCGSGKKYKKCHGHI